MSHAPMSPAAHRGAPRSGWKAAKRVLADDAGRTPLLLLAITLLLLPSILDIDVVGHAAEPFSNTIAAVFAVIGVLVTARLVNRWNMIREQEEAIARFYGLSRIAFRSLSHTVNDVGRMILAPVLGVDLRVLGIPGLGRTDVDDYLAPSRRLGDVAPNGYSSGFWELPDEGHLRELVMRLLSDPEFAPQMFLMTARARRRLQDTLADWAPVMVTVPRAAGELDEGWGLSDALVTSQERWREMAFKGVSTSEEERRRAIDAFSEVVVQYQTWLSALQKKADLPTQGYVSGPFTRS